jgi:small subunit ribosomal protein S20
MAHHASAIRQHRRSIRHQAINKANKSAVRSEVKKIRELIDGKDKEAAKKALPGVYAAIDQTVKKGTIHPNKGARTKSRLTRQIEAINAAPEK